MQTVQSELPPSCCRPHRDMLAGDGNDSEESRESGESQWLPEKDENVFYPLQWGNKFLHFTAGAAQSSSLLQEDLTTMSVLVLWGSHIQHSGCLSAALAADSCCTDGQTWVIVNNQCVVVGALAEGRFWKSRLLSHETHRWRLQENIKFHPKNFITSKRCHFIQP